MIPALIFYLIKRFKRKSNTSKNGIAIKKLATKLKSILFIAAIICSFSFSTIEERKALTYNVVKNNQIIGTIKINKNVVSDSTTYMLQSDIKAKLLFKFNIVGKEKSIYKNGELVYSSVFRTLNNKTKADHEIVLKKAQYHLLKNESSFILHFNSIKQNLITLYFEEPVGVSSVFSDNLNKIVNVKPLQHGKYKVDFSNGKHNIFHYKQGKCIKVEAVGSLFSVTLIPTKL